MLLFPRLNAEADGEQLSEPRLNRFRVGVIFQFDLDMRDAVVHRPQVLEVFEIDEDEVAVVFAHVGLEKIDDDEAVERRFELRAFDGDEDQRIARMQQPMENWFLRDGIDFVLVAKAGDQVADDGALGDFDVANVCRRQERRGAGLIAVVLMRNRRFGRLQLRWILRENCGGRVLGLLPLHLPFEVHELPIAPALRDFWRQGKVALGAIRHDEIVLETAEFGAGVGVDADEADRPSQGFSVGIGVLHHGEAFERFAHGVDLAGQKRIGHDFGHLPFGIAKALDAFGFDDEVRE